jgi:hypothetical protein
MPIDPAYSSKNGLISLNRAAHTMCRIVKAFAPAIRAQYPDNAELQAALTVAVGLCDTLVPLTDAQIASDTSDAQTFDPSPSYGYAGQID